MFIKLFYIIYGFLAFFRLLFCNLFYWLFTTTLHMYRAFYLQSPKGFGFVCSPWGKQDLSTKVLFLVCLLLLLCLAYFTIKYRVFLAKLLYSFIVMVFKFFVPVATATPKPATTNRTEDPGASGSGANTSSSTTNRTEDPGASGSGANTSSSAPNPRKTGAIAVLYANYSVMLDPEANAVPKNDTLYKLFRSKLGIPVPEAPPEVVNAGTISGVFKKNLEHNAQDLKKSTTAANDFLESGSPESQQAHKLLDSQGTKVMEFGRALMDPDSSLEELVAKGTDVLAGDRETRPQLKELAGDKVPLPNFGLVKPYNILDYLREHGSVPAGVKATRNMSGVEEEVKAPAQDTPQCAPQETSTKSFFGGIQGWFSRETK